MELLYLLHFSPDLDNTRYRKSPRIKLCRVTASFVENGTLKATFFVKVVVMARVLCRVGKWRRRPSRHYTMRFRSRRSRQSNRSLLPSQNLVPLKTNTNVSTNISIKDKVAPLQAYVA
jgi:hypothetical protein